MDAGPMLEYFEPLMEWLKNTNKNEQRILGWPNPKGDPSTEAELPELHSEYQNENQNQQWANGDSGLGLGSDGSGERIAFPGQKCEKGQECLLDSQCNGTICVCREGLFTLKIADSYNCVPGDPAKLGFTNDKGGLVIVLDPNEGKDGTNCNGTSEKTNGGPEEEDRTKMSSSNGRQNMPTDNNDGGGKKKVTANGTNGTNISKFVWTILAFLLLTLIPFHFNQY